jgi:hypothetical protein
VHVTVVIKVSSVSAVLLTLRYNVVTVVLQCNNVVTVLSQWCDSGVTGSGSGGASVGITGSHTNCYTFVTVWSH